MATTVNNTMVKIQTVTVGAGGAASIDFTSIPQTYTDLCLVFSIRSNQNESGDGQNPNIKFNNTASNNSWRQVKGLGASVNNDKSTTSALLIASVNSTDTTANTFCNDMIYIPNYTSSNYKSFSRDSVVESNSASTAVYNTLEARLWSDTSAINQVTIYPTNGNFAQYSTATLYGVTATPNTTKASGGIIYQDATYMYHVFPYSGTFTPTQNITADYLVIAGGAGGGAYIGGGGGAGGLRSTVGATGGGGSLESALSLTANTGYTVTIGGGGAGGVTDSTAPLAGSNSVFSTITSTGGGRGGYYNGANWTTGATGGAGGGGALGSAAGGAGTTNQGYAGGTGSSNSGATSTAAGGGGSGAVGSNGATSVPGNGGIGVAISAFANATQTGVNTYYAGGGGGSAHSSFSNTSIGGTGGGGNGGTSSVAGISGLVNTGSGGGGGGVGYNGGAGGSGLVIIRYAK